MPPKRATRSQSATLGAPHGRDRGAGGEGAQTPLKRGNREGGSQSGTTAAAAGQVGRDRSSVALPAVASPLLTAGGMPRSTVAAAAGGQGSGEEGHYQALSQQLEDFFDVEKVTARGLSPEEKEELKDLARKINTELSTKEVERMVNTWTTVDQWGQALDAAEREGNFTVAKALEALAMFRFGIRSLPPAGDKRAEVENLLVDFLLKSLLPGTLAGHIDFLLTKLANKKITTNYPFHIVCKEKHIESFAVPNDVPVDETQAGNDVREVLRAPDKTESDTPQQQGVNVTVTAAARAAGRMTEFPLVIGGESGSGKTIFSVLALKYIMAGHDEAHDQEKAEALTIYTQAGDGKDKHLEDIVTHDSAMQRASDDAASEKARSQRQEAAARCLEQMVRDALDWPGELVLAPAPKYEMLVIVVDELSSHPEFFRSLLVADKEQAALLNFAKGLAEHVQLICCATGSNSYIMERGSQPSEYAAIMMRPSPVLFGAIMDKGNVTKTMLEALLGFQLLAHVVQNRRIGAFAASEFVKDLQRLNADSPVEYNDEYSNVRYGSIIGMRGYAGFVVYKAVRYYCGKNGLSGYSGVAAMAVTLEGLRQLLMWEPQRQPDIEGILKKMGECDPLRLGTFSVDRSESLGSNSFTDKNTSEVIRCKFEDVTLSVSAAQILMVRIRYGAEPSSMMHTPDSFEELSAYVLCTFLDAVRKVPQDCVDGKTNNKSPADYIKNNKKTLTSADLDKFVRALRGSTAAETIELKNFLQSLDKNWNFTTDHAPAAKELTHCSSSHVFFAKKKIEKVENVSALVNEIANDVDKLLEELNSSTEKGKRVFALMNGPQAAYADFFVVAGDILFLGQCKMYENDWGNSAKDVKGELTKMGFNVPDPVKPSKKGGTQQNASERQSELEEASEKSLEVTRALMEKFGCSVAVPLFFVSKHTGAQAKGRDVVAEGHDWNGPAPFIHVLSSVEKTCARPSDPALWPQYVVSFDAAAAAAAPNSNATGQRTQQRRASKRERGTSAPPADPAQTVKRPRSHT